MRAHDSHAGGPRKLAEPPGGGVTVHPGTAAAEQDGAGGAVTRGPVYGAPDSRWQRDEDDLGALPHTRSTRWPRSSPRSAMFAPVASKIRKPRRPRMATKAWSYGFADSRGGEHGLELQVSEPERRRLGRHRRAADVFGW